MRRCEGGRAEAGGGGGGHSLTGWGVCRQARRGRLLRAPGWCAGQELTLRCFSSERHTFSAGTLPEVEAAAGSAAGRASLSMRAASLPFTPWSRSASRSLLAASLHVGQSTCGWGGRQARERSAAGRGTQAWVPQQRVRRHCMLAHAAGNAVRVWRRSVDLATSRACPAAAGLLLRPVSAHIVRTWGRKARILAFSSSWHGEGKPRERWPSIALSA